ncbi:MAG: hypothetical protein A2Y95_03715 [Deltaproteobacteria bacterium RBG_13_65_10]|jgi:cyclopropane fatty-acyl-phospholipid synthase-like methyltransferase|nr:MAG: hypothetical protein A2Y95_03715 [Deltaproteobacteria bacterium RBG_13_65_10]
MSSKKTQGIAQIYSERHHAGWGAVAAKPYANYGYWIREGMTLDEARDAMSEAVAEASGMAEGNRVLEVGCGYGASAVQYTERFKPASVIGLDITEPRIENARKYIAQNGLSDVIKVAVGDATKLDFPDGSFERVIAIECALHFDTREDFLREAARVLVPGGGLGMADICLRKGMDRQAFLEGVHFPAGSDGTLDVPENVHDVDVYAEKLRACGFTDVRIDIITKQTLPPMLVQLHKLARDTQDERGPRRLLAAQIYQRYLDLGLEYVLVSARRGAP